MADRPILFSAPMVRALLAGTKTQTRRILKPKPVAATDDESSRQWCSDHNCLVSQFEDDGDKLIWVIQRPKIKVGDRLWVREAWRAPESLDMYAPAEIGAMDASSTGSPLWFPISYIADDASGGSTWASDPAFGRKRASMHLPRWASRITLAVTDVRVQRLQDISEGDAEAEGIAKIGRFYGVADADWDSASTVSAQDAYGNLWEDINGSGSWDANPWVAAYTFTVHHANIDALSAEKVRA